MSIIIVLSIGLQSRELGDVNQSIIMSKHADYKKESKQTIILL